MAVEEAPYQDQSCPTYDRDFVSIWFASGAMKGMVVWTYIGILVGVVRVSKES